MNVQEFFKANSVFCLAVLGAFLSAFVVPPSETYISYIDSRVLALLFSLMVVVAGLQKAGVFTALTVRLFHILRTTRQLAGSMIFLCFFASMWITNDVSLITFVPFAMVAFQQAGEGEQLIKVVVLQTVAANLGSMCTPVGNPQNLYLFLVSGMCVSDFIVLLLPYTIVSFVLLVASLWWFPSRSLTAVSAGRTRWPVRARFPVALLVVLFLLCMFTVGNVVDYRLTFGIILAVVFIGDREILRHVDYTLLFTFVAFFIFIGNLKQIGAVYAFLTSHTAGHEVLVSLLASQVISNVPAAILLSGFTSNYADLMIGTDIGGLGTLIASMASLISYKLYVGQEGRAGKYLWIFTWVNIVFLGILMICWTVLSGL